MLKLVAESDEATEEAKASANEQISKIALDIQNEANIETLVKAICMIYPNPPSWADISEYSQEEIDENHNFETTYYLYGDTCDQLYKEIDTCTECGYFEEEFDYGHNHRDKTIDLAEYGMKIAEKYKEKPDICNAIGAHHDEVEMTSLIAPIVQVCDAISGARPGARREIVEAYIKRLNDLEQIAMSYPGVTKTYAIQAGRELRVIVGADKIDDKTTETLSADIAKKIQDEMTYPGQVKITVIRETRAVSYAR